MDERKGTGDVQVAWREQDVQAWICDWMLMMARVCSGVRVEFAGVVFAVFIILTPQEPLRTLGRQHVLGLQSNW